MPHAANVRPRSNRKIDVHWHVVGSGVNGRREVETANGRGDKFGMRQKSGDEVCGGNSACCPGDVTKIQ